MPSKRLDDLRNGCGGLGNLNKGQLTQKSPPPPFPLEPESSSVCLMEETIPVGGNCCEVTFPSDPAVCFLFASSWSPDTFLRVEIAVLFHTDLGLCSGNSKGQ